MQNDNLDKLILKAAPSRIEPSANFEARFWQKISEPKTIRLFDWIPVPSAAQVAAAILLAVVIGGAGGVVSAMNSPEVKGVSSSSVTSTYLKLTGSENVK